MVNAWSFPFCQLKSVGTGWQVLVRHREGEEKDKGKLSAQERSLS